MSEVASSLRDVIRPGSKRGLDFVIVDELRKRTGINPESVLKFALSEMLCNALDTDATEINILINIEHPSFCRLQVQDNGSQKLSRKDIKMILDFEGKASSKRGVLVVSRGYLGNALKCIFGYSYALAELKGLAAPDITVKSGGFEHRIALKPDKISEVIKSEIETTKREDDGLTTFIVKFPLDYVTNPSTAKMLEDIVIATSMVNPTRKIAYNFFDIERGTLGSEEGVMKAIRRETSVLWYTEKQFESLFEDFVRARPGTQLKDFIALFRGFTSKNVIREILQDFNASNHDSGSDPNVQFFPATPIKDVPGHMLSKLFAVMKVKAKPIAKRSIASVLGVVGEKSFEKVREQNEWERLRYVMMPGIKVECTELHYSDEPCHNLDHAEFPYLIELAVFDRKQDGEGLKLYQCVTFMASMEDIFSRIYNINYHLGRVGISKDMPVTVVTHLVCPVLKWLNYGKSGLDE